MKLKIDNRNKLFFIGIISLKVIGSLIELAIPILISESFDNYILEALSNKTILLMVLMGVTIIISFIFNYLGNYLAAKNANSIVKENRKQFVKSINDLDLLTFDSIDNHNLLTSLNLDFNNYYLFLQNIQRLGIRGPVLFLGSIALCIYYSLSVSSVILLFVPFVIFIIIFYSIIGVKNSKKIQQLYSDSIEKTQDAFFGAKQIRVNNTQNTELQKFNNTSEELKKYDYKSLKYGNLSNFFTNLLLNICFIIVLFVSSKFVDSELSIGNYLAIISLFSIISHAAYSISKLVIIISRGNASIQRINHIIPSDINIDNSSSLSNNEGIISFNNVSFAYKNKKRFIFENISFSLEKNNIEIVGPIACGKTTLLKLMSGIYKPTNGNIYIDGKETNSYISFKEKEIFGYALQNDYIFQNTIKYNISLERVFTESEFNKAIETACVVPIINNKKEKEDTKIGNNATKISGGEKARIILARALLKNPKYLFIDSILGSLDYETEKTVLENIKYNYPNTIIIAVTQKILNNNDTFIVLNNNGEIRCGKYLDFSNDSFFKDLISGSSE